MKRLILEGIFQAAIWIGKEIRTGKPMATIIGALVGAGFGALAVLVVEFVFLIPGAILGGIAGALLGAWCFPKPAAPSDNLTEQYNSVGGVRRIWTFQYMQIDFLVVLLERAIYAATRNDNVSWDDVVLKLVNGDDPGLPLKGLVRPRAWIIPLASIHALEFSRPDAIDVDVIYSQGSTKTSSVLTFPTAAERDVFFAEAGQLLGCSFARSQRRRTFIGATWAPLTVLVIVTLLTVGAVFLSRYWIANPPPPIQRTGKQDEIVRFLTWAEPEGVLVGAAVPLVAAFGWFFFEPFGPRESRFCRRQRFNKRRYQSPHDHGETI